MKITGARKNKKETILEIDKVGASLEGANLGLFLNKYFGFNPKGKSKGKNFHK